MGRRVSRVAFASEWSRRLLLAGSVLGVIVAHGAALYGQEASPQSSRFAAVDLAVRTANFARAALLLQRAADQGDAEAQYRLASLYRTGRGVAHDDLSAFKWMKAAAKQNHKGAAFNLAR